MRAPVRFIFSAEVLFLLAASASYAAAADNIPVLLNTGGDDSAATHQSDDATATPDPFSFVDQTGVERSTRIISAPVTITGIDGAAPISVSEGRYSIGCGNKFTSDSGTIENGQTVCVRHTSSENFSTATDTILTVGSASDTFTSTTLAQDIEPNSFTFTDVTEVSLNSMQISNTVTVGGYDAAAPIGVSGGEYSVGCTDTFTSAPGTISNGEMVCVRHTSSADFGTVTDTTLTVGGVSDTFTSITLTQDLEPNSFTFTDALNVPLNSTQISNTITISGYDGAAPISVSGGEYSIGCTGTFTSAPGTISNGETVCVRHTSSASPSTATDTILTVGSVSHTFRSITPALLDPYHVTGSLGLWDGLLGLLVALGYGYRPRSARKSRGNSAGA